MSFQRKECEELLKRLDLPGHSELPAFNEFVREWLPRGQLQSFFDLDGGKQGPTSTAMLQLLYSVFIASKVGNPVFEVKPDLVTSLRDTETPTLPIEMLKTPFEALRVDVPRRTFAFPAEEVQEIFILYMPGSRFRVVFTQGEYVHFVSIMTDDPMLSIKDSILRTLVEANKTVPVALWDEIKKEALYDDYSKADVFRFAVNLALYVTCPDADMYQDKTEQHEVHQKLQGVKAGRKRDVLLRKLGQARQTKRYIVGANTRLDKEYTAQLTESGKKWVLQRRVHVMGHWRSQPYGPRNSLRRPKWIAPFWKGPTYAEMVEKGYVLR